MKNDDCLPLQGMFAPVINLEKCNGKTTCVEICPYNVFEMKVIDSNAYSSLSFTGKLKTFIYGKEKAHVINPDECRACGICVNQCYDGAITLERINSKENLS